MFAPLRALARDPEGKVLVVGTVSILAIGTVAYSVLEGWTPVDALYFSVVTLATVGYGDFHPTTEAGRLFTIVYILVGIGILAGFVSELTKHRKGAERAAEDLHVVDAESVEAEEQAAGGADPR